MNKPYIEDESEDFSVMEVDERVEIILLAIRKLRSMSC